MGTIDYFSLVICKWNDNSAIKSELDNAEVLYLMMEASSFAPVYASKSAHATRGKLAHFKFLPERVLNLKSTASWGGKRSE